MRTRSFPAAAIFFALTLGCRAESKPPAVGAALDREAVISEELRISGEQANLAPINWVSLAPNGTLAVSQRFDQTARLFSVSGDDLGSIGGRGSGPGEFGLIGEGGWIHDTIWLRDSNPRRITFFTEAGSLVRVISEPAPTGLSTIATWGVLPDRSIIAIVPPAIEDFFTGFYPDAVVARVSEQGEIQKTLAVVSFGHDRIRSQSGTLLFLPFPERLFLDFSSDGGLFAAATPTLTGVEAGTFGLTVWNADGDTVFTRRHPFTRRSISKTVADSVLDVFGKRAESSGHAELFTFYQRVARVPEFLPPLEKLLLGEDGTVWVTEVPDSGLRRIMAISPTGEPLGSLHLPATSRLMAADDGRIWVIEEDLLGVESLVRYAVEWP